ncbi:MAG: fibronectin type III domain-containing protein [Clostridia bacterium]|nr:fibronectin type III domain-containing protein [Clostridia bacterium]
MGHKYNATWNWSGISSADLIYKCVNGCGYSKTVKGTITSVSKKATLKANGVKTYTAKATLNKKTYTNVKKVIIYKPAKFALSNAVCVYTGKAQNPKVTVKDAAGKVISSKFYTVAYSDNVKVGTATAKVTFKGNYSGTKVLTYKIVKKPTVGRPGGLAASSITANSLKLSWNNVSGATGYIVYRYIASSDKYQKIGSVKSNGITINNLKASSTYKYCVQAYVVKYGQTFYSAKSPVLSVKTKAGSSVKYYKNTNVPDFGWYCGTKLYDSSYDDGVMTYSYLWDDYYYYSTNRNTISDYESYIKKFGFSYFGYDYGDHGTFYQYINYKTETLVVIMVPYDYEGFIIVGINNM